MVSHSMLAQAAAESYFKPPSYQVGDLAVWVTSAGKWRDNVIAFRGSCNVQNWIRDFEAIPKKFNKLGYLHEGFGKATQLLLNKIPVEIFKPEAGKRIYLVGHSLGGAIALATAAALKAEGKIGDPIVVTFGAPRVGSFRYKHFLKDIEIFQYKRRGDIVPDLVPPLLFASCARPILMFHGSTVCDIGSVEYVPLEAHSINGYIESLNHEEISHE